MRRIIYFSIEPRLPVRAPISLFVQDEKNELFLSPHVRLCGFPAMAHIESESLAQQFAEACTPRLQKRYGSDTRLEILSWEAMGDKKLLERIRRDTNIIRKRLDTGSLAPNKAP